MPQDPDITTLLERCQGNPELVERAWVLLRTYHGRGLNIAASKATDADKERQLHAAREQLRTGLCDLVEPLNLEPTGDYAATSPAAGGTQQTNSGA